MKKLTGFIVMLVMSGLVFSLKMFPVNVIKDLGKEYIDIIDQKNDVRVEVPLDPSLSTFITKLDKVKHLVEAKKFDVNFDLSFENGTMKPLHFASYHGQADIVKYLISKGVDVNARDSFGNTPLYHAILGLINNDTSNVIMILVESGSEIRKVDIDKCLENAITTICEYLKEQFNKQQTSAAEK